MTKRPTPSVAFSWNGLPQYAARLLASAIRELGQPCPVVGSRPEVPVGGMQEVLGQAIHWVETDSVTSWATLGVPVPDIFFQSGWSSPAFNSLGDEVRRAGGRVCLLMDNRWRGDSRQLVGGAWFRLRMRRTFSAVLVPGKSGRRLATWFGMPSHSIYEGMYGADPTLFFNGPPLSQRPKKIIFVGQYIDRKGCLPLARVFAELADVLPDWELDMYGSGPLRGCIPHDSRIRVNDFVQPEALGALYRESRVFALPSVEEHWGLVVHEAALSGCQLLLSDAVGAGADLATPENAAVFRAGDASDMKKAVLTLTSFMEPELARAQEASQRLSMRFGPSIFAARVHAVVERLSAQ